MAFCKRVLCSCINKWVFKAILNNIRASDFPVLSMSEFQLAVLLLENDLSQMNDTATFGRQLFQLGRVECVFYLPTHDYLIACQRQAIWSRAVKEGIQEQHA